MLAFLLALLWAGPPPASAQTVRLQVRPSLVRAGVPLSWTAAPLSAPLSTLLPPLAAPALSPLAPAPALLDPPVAAAVPAAPVLSGLESWYSQAAERGTPGAAALSGLWDGSGLKAAAPADASLPAPVQAPAPQPALAAPEFSGSAELTPGSIFDWKPVEGSPNHGLPLLDRLVRWALGPEGGRFRAGYEMTDAPRREDARVFFYGEKHSDEGLIEQNMRRIAADIRPGRGAMILDEGYLGPRLYGSEALDYLERKGFDRDWLGPGARFGADLELSGWDDEIVYNESKHPLLQHHMNLLDINQHLYSTQRGLGYYRELARKAWAAFQNWRILRRLAITERNRVLDEKVASALAEAGRSGKSLHVIAGADHLVERPMLQGLPLIGKASLRRGLLQALGAAPYWAGKPADSPSR